MNNDRQLLILTLVSIVMITIMFITGISLGEKKGYRQGQTDALNGKWKYEMKTDTVTTVVEKQ